MSDDRLNIDFTIMVDPDFRGSSEEMAAVVRKFVEYARQSKWPALDALISAIKDFSYFWMWYIDHMATKVLSEEQAEELLKVIVVRPLLLRGYSPSPLSPSELEEFENEGYRAVAEVMNYAADRTIEKLNNRG